MKRRERQNERQKLSFKSIFQELGLIRVWIEWLHSRKRR